MKNSHAIILLIAMFLFFIWLTYQGAKFVENKGKIREALRLQNSSPKIQRCVKCGYVENMIYFKNNKCPRCGKDL